MYDKKLALSPSNMQVGGLAVGRILEVVHIGGAAAVSVYTVPAVVAVVEHTVLAAALVFGHTELVAAFVVESYNFGVEIVVESIELVAVSADSIEVAGLVDYSVLVLVLAMAAVVETAVVWTPYSLFASSCDNKNHKRQYKPVEG
jgi:hypothetical protein